MQRLSIADYFKRELDLKHNMQKLKELQKLDRSSYSIKAESLPNGREGMVLYYEGDKGLITFLEDYLELFDPNVASAQDTVIIIDGKIRELINEGGKEVEEKEVKPTKKTRGPKKPLGEEKYTVDEIRDMFSEFMKLEGEFGPKAQEIEKWFRLREIFKK